MTQALIAMEVKWGLQFPRFGDSRMLSLSNRQHNLSSRASKLYGKIFQSITTGRKIILQTAQNSKVCRVETRKIRLCVSRQIHAYFYI